MATTFTSKTNSELVEVVGFVNVSAPTTGTYKRKTETLYCVPGKHNFRRPAGMRGVKPKHCSKH